MKQKLNCILLPTEKSKEASKDILKCIKSYASYGEEIDTAEEGQLIIGISKYMDDRYFIKQNLFLVSSEDKPKQGDWILMINTNVHITQCVNTDENSVLDWRKIIASTNGKELGLPTISQESLELYVKHQPSEVYVELERVERNPQTFSKEFDEDDVKYLPKENSLGEVSFTLGEESWEEIMDRMSEEVENYGDPWGVTYKELEWLKKNYTVPKSIK